MKQRDQFMRIAMARLKSDYPFYPQRLAYAASMWRRYYEKNYGKK
jgi:hypothetical protein